MGKKGGEKSENLQVCVRVRPLSDKERAAGWGEVVTTDLVRSTVTVSVDSEFKTYSFDQIFNKEFTQKDIYLRTTHPVVESVLEGYNATVFAYGQSGTGKTHTMSGVIGTPEQGVIPNALNHIFETISGADPDRVCYSVCVSFLELYNGKCRDLLTDKKRNLELKENAQKLFFVKDLEKVSITGGMLQCMRLMEEGSHRREVGATQLNQDSSRSHSVFTIELTALNRETEPPTTCVSKLNLVDLAGSERQSKTGAEGDQLKEGSNINLSLSALGTVIDVLVKGKGHIPFRSSPLTMLLKDSLGGSSRTVMFATVGPADANTPETLSTLRFADRAKKIKNKPVLQLDPKDALIASLREQIHDLKSRLGVSEGDGPVDTRADELEVELCMLRQEREQAAEELRQAQERVRAAEANTARERDRADDAAVAADAAAALRAQLSELSTAVTAAVTAELPVEEAHAWVASGVSGEPMSAARAADGIRRAVQSSVKAAAAASTTGSLSPAPAGTDAITLLEKHGSELSQEAKGQLADALRQLEMQYSAALSQLKAERDAMRQSASERPSDTPRMMNATDRTASQQPTAAAGDVPALDSSLPVPAPPDAGPSEKTERLMSELAAVRAAAERAQRNSERQRAERQRLREEAAELAQRLVAAEQRYRADLEASQSALVAENARRLENVMVGHAEELSRARKQGLDAKKKVRKLRDHVDDLTAMYDAKVVEHDALLRDYEEFKIRALQASDARSPQSWFAQGGGGWEARAGAGARLASLVPSEPDRHPNSAPPAAAAPASGPGSAHAGRVSAPPMPGAQQRRSRSSRPVAHSTEAVVPVDVPGFARPPLPALPRPPETARVDGPVDDRASPSPVPAQRPARPRQSAQQLTPGSPTGMAPAFAKAPLGAIPSGMHPAPPQQSRPLNDGPPPRGAL